VPAVEIASNSASSRATITLAAGEIDLCGHISLGLSLRKIEAIKGMPAKSADREWDREAPHAPEAATY
jgi:hypothetical protein